METQSPYVHAVIKECFNGAPLDRPSDMVIFRQVTPECLPCQGKLKTDLVAESDHMTLEHLQMPALPLHLQEGKPAEHVPKVGVAGGVVRAGEFFFRRMPAAPQKKNKIRKVHMLGVIFRLVDISK